MSAVKEGVQLLLERLPDNCTFEDVQYHLYVIEKIQKGIERAESEGAIPHNEVKKRLNKWIIK